MFQLHLQFLNSKDFLKDYLEEMTGKSITLNLTDNSTSVLSIRTKGNSVSVRMHRMFLNADDDVIREMASFLKTRKGRTPFIRKFISENQACMKTREQNPKQFSIRTKGRFHNLKEIFDNIKNEYFEGKITASISWGKGNARRAVRNRTLGSYCGNPDTIRINPILDRRNVPRYFIRYIVYHEMLHGVVKEERKNGRKLVHTSDFRKLERLFKDYGKAISWEKRLMQKRGS